MDFVAALGLVMVIEGLALALFSKSIPALIAEIEAVGPERLRKLGVMSVAFGGAVYLLVRAA